MKLYYAPGACSLSPHIVATEAGVPVEMVKVDLGKHKTESGEDFNAILRSLTKWADHIEHPTQASLSVARAFQEMASGRTGAAALQGSWDFFTRTAGVGPPVKLAPLRQTTRSAGASSTISCPQSSSSTHQPSDLALDEN